MTTVQPLHDRASMDLVADFAYEIDGLAIPTGDQFTLILLAANRDPEVWG